MNPESEKYSLSFIPVKPTVIEQTRNYTYDDLKWYRLSDGNTQAPIVFAIPNCYLEFASDTDDERKSNDLAFGQTTYLAYSSLMNADPDRMGLWTVGYFMAEKASDADNITCMKILVDQFKTYIDSDNILVYGKTGLELPENLKDTLIGYRDVVKKIAQENYLPDKTIWDKPVCERFSYELRSSADRFRISMNVQDDPYVYYHELTHYYHLQNMDYGCQISAWTEGIAVAVCEDCLLQQGMDTSEATCSMHDLSFITEENMNYFEQYFINVGYEDCYAVGYNFIRFIQKQYGADVVYRINKNIQKNIKYSAFGVTSPGNRTEDLNNLFLKAVKDETSENVFLRFVEEVLNCTKSKAA